LDQWEVLIPDHLPGYITWEHYEANLQRLARNSARAEAMRAARGGDSLLAGLVVCGRCGRRMLVAYTTKGHRVRYACQRGAMDYAEPRCQCLAGGALDELVAGQVLRALEPAALELSLRAVADAERERARLARQWEQRLERARHDAERAARQYHAAEPDYARSPIMRRPTRLDALIIGICPMRSRSAFEVVCIIRHAPGRSRDPKGGHPCSTASSFVLASSSASGPTPWEIGSRPTSPTSTRAATHVVPSGNVSWPSSTSAPGSAPGASHPRT
jgi:hypothetical protein